MIDVNPAAGEGSISDFVTKGSVYATLTIELS